jgi:hypothetical protein
MDVLYFLLARYAEQTPDGSMNIMGAGIDTVTAPFLPYYHPSLYVVAKIAMSNEEAKSEHILNIIETTPDGKVLLTTKDMRVSPKEMPPDLKILPANMLFAFQGLFFPTEGEYKFELLYDKEVKKTVTIRMLVKQGPALLKGMNSGVTIRE